MNANFKINLLKTLAAKKNSAKGFTLIELLVVVIIIGVLAAIALPNLLGQVGKARESEAKTALGSLNRSQQGYHLEKGAFYVGDAANFQARLGVSPGTEFYVYGDTVAVAGVTDGVTAVHPAIAKTPATNGVRDFSSSVKYNTADAQYYTLICVADEIAAEVAGEERDKAATPGVTAGDAETQTCTGGTAIN